MNRNLIIKKSKKINFKTKKNRKMCKILFIHFSIQQQLPQQIQYFHFPREISLCVAVRDVNIRISLRNKCKHTISLSDEQFEREHLQSSEIINLNFESELCKTYRD